MSGLSAQGIYPKGNDLVHSARGDGGYRGDGARFAYSGWSCFSKQLAKAPKGWPAPMVMTWSNPVQIRLTDEGKMLGAWMHAAAETRGDCACGLMSAETVARAEAASGESCSAPRSRTNAPPRRAKALKALSTRIPRRWERAPRRTPPRSGASARARDASGNRQYQGVRSRGGAGAPPPARARITRSPPRARAAAAAETRRSTDLHAPRASAPAPAPSDDDVVVLDDDEEEADERDLPPFLSVSENATVAGRRRRASRRARIRGAEGARPRGTRDADVSPRAARPSAAPATRGASRRASTPRWAPSPGARRGSLRFPPGRRSRTSTRSC